MSLSWTDRHRPSRSLFVLAAIVSLTMAACGAPPQTSVAAPSSAKMRAATEALLAGARANETDAMLVVRDGEVLAEYRKPKLDPDGIEMMSATKSLVALGIGRLIQLRRIKSIDQPVGDFYPEWKQGQKALITIRMLMNHTSGLQNLPNTRYEIYPAPDAIKLALAAELTDPPGTRFEYNNKATNLLAGIIERASGQRMDRFLSDELLRHLGVTDAPWNEQGGFDPTGNPYGMSGWKATTQTAIKVGQLLLDEGRWNGRALIDAEFMRQMVAQGSPLDRYCGLLWWRRTEHRQYAVNRDGLSRLASAGVAATDLEALRALGERRFGTEGQALRAAFDGHDGAEAFRQRLLERKLRSTDAVADLSGPIEAYSAEGFLGQYIVVVPKARLVAVRQIDSRPQIGEWPYNYTEFVPNVIALGRALEPDLSLESAPTHISDND